MGTSDPVRERILRHLYHSETKWVAQSRYNDLLDESRQAVSKAVRDLEDEDLIEKEKRGRSNFLRLSADGYLEMREGGHVSDTVDNHDTGSRGGSWIRLHNVVVHIPVDLQDMSEMERWMKRDLDDVRGDGGDGLVGDWGSGYLRVTHEGLFIQMDEVAGQSVDAVKAEALVRAFELVEWFEDDVGVDVDRSPRWIEVEVSEEHLASVEDAFCEWCEEHDVGEFKVKSREGDFYEYKLDRSTGELELECEKRNRAESNIREFKRFMQGLADGAIEVDELEEIGDSIELLAVNQAMIIQMLEKIQEGDENSSSTDVGEAGGESGQSEESRDKDYYDSEMEKALDRMDKWAHQEEI